MFFVEYSRQNFEVSNMAFAKLLRLIHKYGHGYRIEQ